MVNFWSLVLIVAGYLAQTRCFRPVVITSDAFKQHRVANGFHPESPDRIAAVQAMIARLEAEQKIEVRKPTAESDKEEESIAMQSIRLAHSDDYIRKVYALSRGGARLLDPFDDDTYLNTFSFQQCVLAQSAWINAAEHCKRTGGVAFALTRPPGHHAGRETSSGFCIFNFAAATAKYALKNKLADRVAIFDFDVHFGQGTCDIISSDPKIFYASCHQIGIYPSPRGSADERGQHNNILSLPLPAGATFEHYMTVLDNVIPAIKAFDPQLLVVSAGYDALKADELADISLRPEDFGNIAGELRRHFGNIVFGLEGGYDLTEMPLALQHTIEAFL